MDPDDQDEDDLGQPTKASTRTVESDCRKRSYRSRSEAHQATRKASWRIRVYQCPDCGRWHATNAEKR